MSMFYDVDMDILYLHRLKEIKKLYYHDKLSAREIANQVGIPMDAVYRIMRRNNLKRRTLTEQNAVRFEKKEPSFTIKTELTPEEKQLKIAGSMLYWAEGFQVPEACTVDFANSKPQMIVVFLNFLRTICGVKESKLRAYLYAYANQDISEIVSFWSGLTNISKGQFSKPYIRKDFDVKKVGKMKYGLIHIRYHDKKLLMLIRQWIEEYAEHCIISR